MRSCPRAAIRQAAPLNNGGTLRADQGLHNAGRLQISFGGAEIFDELNNGPAGQVIASGGAHTTFWDRVVNDGEIRAGAHMVCFEAVSGSRAAV